MTPGTPPPPSPNPSRPNSPLLHRVEVTEPENHGKESPKSSRRSSNGSRRGSQLSDIRPLGHHSSLTNLRSSSSRGTGLGAAEQPSTPVGGARPKVSEGNGSQPSAVNLGGTKPKKGKKGRRSGASGESRRSSSSSNSRNSSQLTLVHHKNVKGKPGQLGSQIALQANGGKSLLTMPAPKVAQMDFCSGGCQVKFTRKLVRCGKSKAREELKVSFSYSGDNGDYQSTQQLDNAFLVEGIGSDDHSGIFINLGQSQSMEVLFDPRSRRLLGINAGFNEHTLENVVGFEPHDSDYKTYFVVTEGMKEVPMCLIGIDFDNWNDDCEARVNMLRSILGGFFNASKDQKCDLRTIAHICTTIWAVSNIIVTCDGVISPWIMKALGLPVVSYTGGVDPTDDQKAWLRLAVICLFICAIASGAVKDMKAMEMNQEPNPEIKKQMAKLVMMLEVGGAQLLTNGINTLCMLPAGLTDPWKLIIDNNLPHAIFLGGAGIAQGKALSLGYSAVCAFATYSLIRLLIYRPASVATQVGTTYGFLGSPYFHEANGSSELRFYQSQNETDPFLADHGGTHWLEYIAAIVIAQLSIEAGLAFAGAATYWAGGRKKPDGSEEQMRDYANRQGFPLHTYNRARLMCSGAVDAVSRGIGRGLSYIGRQIQSLYQNMGGNAAGAAILGLGDDEYLALRRREGNGYRIREGGQDQLPSDQAEKWLNELGESNWLDELRAKSLDGFDGDDMKALQEVMELVQRQMQAQSDQGAEQPQNVEEPADGDPMNQMWDEHERKNT